MALLTMSEAGRSSCQSRLGFLQQFLTQRPSLHAEDRQAVSPEGSRIALADAHWQVIELALALDEVATARGTLKALADDRELATSTPLRWLGAAIIMRAPIQADIWRLAALTARSEALVELFWAAWFAGERGQERHFLPEAARCARIYRLERILRSDRQADRAHADVLLFAMYSDYAVRLEVQSARDTTFPLGWSLIDWPLLLLHLAMLRRRRELHVMARLPSIFPLPDSVLDVARFLERTAIELNATDSRLQ